MKRTIAVAFSCLLAISGIARGEYVQDFEGPLYSGLSEGDPIDGIDGWTSSTGPNRILDDAYGKAGRAVQFYPGTGAHLIMRWMEESEKGIALVDEQLQILLDETGLPEDEVLHLPFLHHSVFGLSVAYQPGTVNGISLSQTVFASPRPYGPKIDGVDIFEAQMIEEYAKVGVTVYWVEDWDLYHVLLGEVHCGSNAFRETPSVKWWETGR